MMVDESIPSGARSGPLPNPSVLAFSISAAHRITRRVSSPGPSTRAAEHQQVGDHPEGHPPLHPGETTIPTSPEPVASLQGADPPFRAGAPSESGSNAARAAFSALPGQDDQTHSVIARRLVIGSGGEPAIGDREARRPPEELFVSDE